MDCNQPVKSPVRINVSYQIAVNSFFVCGRKIVGYENAIKSYNFFIQGRNGH